MTTKPKEPKVKRTEIYSIGSSKSLATYVNNLPAEASLVYFYLLSTGMTSLILSPNFNVPKWLKELEIIVSVSKDGNNIAYSECANLFAKQHVK